MNLLRNKLGYGCSGRQGNYLKFQNAKYKFYQILSNEINDSKDRFGRHRPFTKGKLRRRETDNIMLIVVI